MIEWPWKTTGHLFCTTLSFVQNFTAISEFKDRDKDKRKEDLRSIGLDWPLVTPSHMYVKRYIKKKPLLWKMYFHFTFRSSDSCSFYSGGFINNQQQQDDCVAIHWWFHIHLKQGDSPHSIFAICSFHRHLHHALLAIFPDNGFYRHLHHTMHAIFPDEQRDYTTLEFSVISSYKFACHFSEGSLHICLIIWHPYILEARRQGHTLPRVQCIHSCT